MTDTLAPADLGPVPRRPESCPVERWLNLLGHRWMALVLWHLSSGPCHHADLMRRLPGISPKVLAERLSALRAAGLVERTAAQRFPRTVSYALTAQGARMVSILDQLEVLTAPVA